MEPPTIIGQFTGIAIVSLIVMGLALIIGVIGSYFSKKDIEQIFKIHAFRKKNH